MSEGSVLNLSEDWADFSKFRFVFFMLLKIEGFLKILGLCSGSLKVRCFLILYFLMNTEGFVFV